MNLVEINDANFRSILLDHKNDGGDLVNESLSKLFNSLNDETGKYEVQIKVAALNQLYSTAIQYIAPVVDKIVEALKMNNAPNSFNDYCNLVDKIAIAKWQSPTTGKLHERNNLSFASKYIHFLSKYQTPIYDSYIWIVIIGYLIQKNGNAYKFDQPKTYSEFIKTFNKFKIDYNLEKYSNYQIDKFLWQYGKSLVTLIITQEKVTLDKAKAILKKRLTTAST